MKLNNPLTTKDEYSLPGERLMKTVFQEIEAIDTHAKLEDAIRNIEIAEIAASRWQRDNMNEKGEIIAGTTFEMFRSYEMESHALNLLADIYAQRQQMLEDGK